VQSKNQLLSLAILKEKDISITLKREDLLHPYISGNKYRKLKYNLEAAQMKGHHTLLTFGGAYSNHIDALAYAGKEKGMQTIGVIRGEEIKNTWQNNATLKRASANGMEFKFVSRETYREKDSDGFVSQLRKDFGDFYIIPEGGTNALAVKGCEEILNSNDQKFDIICTCVGTGGTVSGLINASNASQTVLGFSALKGDFLKSDIRKIVKKDNWRLITDYHFGGYAKINRELIDFINQFKATTDIPLDPIYTGKMLFGLLDMIKNDNFVPGTNILVIHTGGIQGIEGMNMVLKKKNLPLITI
jgi:1-aminocyclopropane-1-carboxylate deaminase